jgi:hypothetical protein
MRTERTCSQCKARAFHAAHQPQAIYPPNPAILPLIPITSTHFSKPGEESQDVDFLSLFLTLIQNRVDGLTHQI